MQTPCRALGYLVGTLAVSDSGVRSQDGIRGVAASRTLLSGHQSLTSLHILHLLLTPLPSCRLSGTILCSYPEFQAPFLTSSPLLVLVSNSQEQKVTPTSSRAEPASHPNPLGELPIPPFSSLTVNRPLSPDRNSTLSFSLAPRHAGALGVQHLWRQRPAGAHTNTVRRGIHRKQRDGNGGSCRAAERRAAVAGARHRPVSVSAWQGRGWQSPARLRYYSPGKQEPEHHHFLS